MPKPETDTGDTERAHPRHAERLLGHAEAERRLAHAHARGKLGHAWLITGPRGIGKATLAYRLARHVLAGGGDAGPSLFGDEPSPAQDLHLDPEHPVFRRVAAASHADLRTIERVRDDKGRLRREIVVDDIRTLGPFFALTPAEGGWRIAVIDAAEDMNRNAANALLKLLEEPPPNALLLLVSHVPGWLPATIRSRCRRLKLAPLAHDIVVELLQRERPGLSEDETLALAGLAEGSIGRALALADRNGRELFSEIIAILAGLPDLDIARIHKFADRLGARGDDAEFVTAMDLLGRVLARHAVSTARGSGPGERLADEAALGDRLSLRLDRWLELWEKFRHLVERTDRINLDRKQVVLNVFTAIENAARS